MNDKTKMRRYIVILLVIAFVVYGGVSFNKPHQHDAELKKFIAWDGVPAILESVVNSSQYQMGGVYLANSNKLNTNSSNEQRDAYSYRLAIDFLRSLTPEQISCFQNKQVLPFNKLSKEQHLALFQMRYSRIEGGPAIKSNDVSNSYILLGTLDKQRYLIVWNQPLKKKNQGSTRFYMEFLKNGNGRFMYPYRHL